MLKVIEDEKLPIKLWLNDLDKTALGQARNLANLDEVMNNQKDLVEILVELKPLAVVKG